MEVITNSLRMNPTRLYSLSLRVSGKPQTNSGTKFARTIASGTSPSNICRGSSEHIFGLLLRWNASFGFESSLKKTLAGYPKYLPLCFYWKRSPPEQNPSVQNSLTLWRPRIELRCRSPKPQLVDVDRHVCTSRKPRASIALPAVISS